MASQKQIEANRKNSKKSTGPRTPEGRLASSHNAVRHGLSAEQVVIEGENEANFNELLQAFEADFQPATALEHTLVHQIVAAQWRLRRLRQIETGFFEMQFLDNQDTLDDDYSELDNHHKLAFVVHRDSMSSNTLLSLSRYETRVERSFYRALHELRGLRSVRAEHPCPPPDSVLPNEPNLASAQDSAGHRDPAPAPVAERPAATSADRRRHSRMAYRRSSVASMNECARAATPWPRPSDCPPARPQSRCAPRAIRKRCIQ